VVVCEGLRAPQVRPRMRHAPFACPESCTICLVSEADRRHVSKTWAKDWDSQEDAAAYDWIDDESLSSQEVRARFDALMEQGEPAEIEPGPKPVAIVGHYALIVCHGWNWRSIICILDNWFNCRVHWICRKHDEWLIAKEAKTWGKETLKWAESVDGEDPDSDT
jgi:hypothetical protein